MELPLHIVTTRGEGFPYEPLTSEPVVAPARGSGVAHFRNRGSANLVLSVTIAGPFGPMTAELVVPAGADRFVSLSNRLATDGQSIAFRPSGDLSAADVTLFERDVLDRA
jgi:hypothetical protein